MENFNKFDSANDIFKLFNCMQNNLMFDTEALEDIDNRNLIYRRLKHTLISAIREITQGLMQENMDLDIEGLNYDSFFILPLRLEILHYTGGLTDPYTVELLGNESNNQIAYNPTAKKFKVNFCLESFKQALFTELYELEKVLKDNDSPNLVVELNIAYNVGDSYCD